MPIHPIQNDQTITAFPLHPMFQTNCYVIQPKSGDSTCWIADCGYEPAPMIEWIQSNQLSPSAIVLTHAHPDHMAGLNQLRNAFPSLPIWIHEAEEDWLTDGERNLSTLLAGKAITAPAADRLLSDSESLDLCGESWQILHTPGHSPGSITLHNADRSIAIVGDTLFNGGIGRTDFPGCSFETLEESIRTTLYTLPAHTACLPGHGPPTTIGHEAQTNPFVTTDS